MSDDDLNALEDSFSEARDFAAHINVVQAGETLTGAHFVVEGFLGRYSDDSYGERQIVAVYMPGDFIDLHTAPMKNIAHSVCTLTPCTIATILNDDFEELVARRPSLVRKLWYSSLMTSAISEQWIFCMGRLSSVGRVCHQLCEIHARLNAIGRTDRERFSLPINQQQLAEICGITAVHLNRVLSELRKSNILTFRQGIVHMENRNAAEILGEFDPAYLNLEESEESPQFTTA